MTINEKKSGALRDFIGEMFERWKTVNTNPVTIARQKTARKKKPSNKITRHYR